MSVVKRLGITHGLAATAILWGLGAPTASAELKPFVEIVGRQAREAEAAKRSYVIGRNGWLFFAPELRSLSVGPFWGDRAASVSRANNKKYADPLEPIVDFHRQLKAAGISLRVVPVPAKAVIYPDSLTDQLKPGSDARPRRHDLILQQFYKRLAKRGVPVIDLVPAFLKQRNTGTGPLYCRTDTHWSGRGVALAAAEILDSLDDPKWLKPLPRFNSVVRTRAVTITGDLARMQNPDNPRTESVSLIFVGKPGDNRQPQPTPISRQSPVLVMGDSHTLVFHDPTLHAAGAGLPDHLASGLGIPVDLIGVRGSGSTATRISLLRRRDNLKGKKLVIWCFSVREFTESFSGWRKVPVIRSAKSPSR